MDLKFNTSMPKNDENDPYKIDGVIAISFFIDETEMGFYVKFTEKMLKKEGKKNLLTRLKCEMIHEAYKMAEDHREKNK